MQLLYREGININNACGFVLERGQKAVFVVDVDQVEKTERPAGQERFFKRWIRKRYPACRKESKIMGHEDKGKYFKKHPEGTKVSDALKQEILKQTKDNNISCRAAEKIFQTTECASW